MSNESWKSEFATLILKHVGAEVGGPNAPEPVFPGLPPTPNPPTPNLPVLNPQQVSCEQVFLNGIAEDGTQMARDFVMGKLLHRAGEYVNCRFGADTPQAQVAWTEVAQIVAVCVGAHTSKLIAKDYGGFITGVLGCVATKLMDGGGGIVPPTPPGGGNLTAADFSTQQRCN